MQWYGLNELREMFLNFFEEKDHLRMKSFSLVPHNDNSLLLINSGMAPLKPYFTGQEIPPRRRVTTCQKCIRTGDIENVGKTARHGTFFEMLGNFSFGDYFKHEAIEWSWEFLTKVVGIPEDRLYPSVYVDDDEAFDIWHNEIGIAKDRIFKFGKEDNFWEHGSGPCGPCSEIYYDRGEKYGCGKPDCTVGCECDRYIEIWNNVFSQFDSDGKGNYADLIQKNIDTGMGLERLATVVQDVDSIFDVDTVKSIRDKVCELSGTEYMTDAKKDVSIRVVTDHIRSVTFMVSDGIMPSNSGRGYVLRRLLRRACRHGRLLGIEGSFLLKLVNTVIEGSKGGYPELSEKKEFIFNVIEKEEANFNKTIDQGLSILADMEADMEKNNTTVLSGENAFKLYDTYGFPIDLTREILEEKGLTFDEEGFKNAQAEQRKQSEGTFGTHSMSGKDATVYDLLDTELSTEFVGYDNISCEAVITALTTESEVVDALSDGGKGTVITDKTPFYATMGGQETDTGIIITADGEFVVEESIHLAGTKVGHVGYVSKGMVKTGDKATLTIDAKKRALCARNHSATHLLQKALRDVLGTHVEQAGSSVNEDRLRFDFTHFSAMTDDELKLVERMVNENIAKGLAVDIKNLPIEEAKKTGAQALFGEKYGDVVRVVDMGRYSVEFCGGTHVTNTAEINSFKILSETGISAGVRRIEAITSEGVAEYYANMEKLLNDACKLIKATPDNLSDKISSLLSDNKSLHSEIDSLKSKMANEAAGDVMNQVEEINGVKLIAAALSDVDMNELRNLGDQMKEKLGEGVVVLASDAGGKVNLMVTATEGAIKLGAHSGNLIKAIAGIVGGGGGGRPNMAQAGGKNPAGIPEALNEAKRVLSGQLS